MINFAPALLVAALAGLALGSYAVTAALRYARAEASARGRSHCDACGQTLGFAQTVPIVSYFQAGGVCRSCRARIDPLHLAGEVAGLVVLLTAVLVGDVARGALMGGLGLALVWLAAVDWKVGRLPDPLVAVVAMAGLSLSALNSFEALAAGLVAAAVAFAIFQGLRLATARQARGAALGFGDVKLICAMALWLGALTPWMVVGAAILGLTFARLSRPAAGRLAFGPMLALAGWAVGMVAELRHWPTTV